MVEDTDAQHGWEHIPPELAAVARRSGISAAELVAFRDDPANQDTGLPELDDRDWERILALPPEGSGDAAGEGGSVDGPTRVADDPLRRVLPPFERPTEPDDDDRRCCLARLGTLQLHDSRAEADLTPASAIPADAIPADATGDLRNRTTVSAEGEETAHTAALSYGVDLRERSPLEAGSTADRGSPAVLAVAGVMDRRSPRGRHGAPDDLRDRRISGGSGKGASGGDGIHLSLLDHVSVSARAPPGPRSNQCRSASAAPCRCAMARA